MVPGAGNFIEGVLQYLLQPHVHDVRENSPLRVARSLARRAGQLEDIALRNQRLECSTETLFQALGIVLGDLETMHDIGGEVSARAEGGAGVAGLFPLGEVKKFRT